VPWYWRHPVRRAPATGTVRRTFRPPRPIRSRNGGFPTRGRARAAVRLQRAAEFRHRERHHVLVYQQFLGGVVERVDRLGSTAATTDPDCWPAPSACRILPANRRRSPRDAQLRTNRHHSCHGLQLLAQQIIGGNGVVTTAIARAAFKGLRETDAAVEHSVGRLHQLQAVIEGQQLLARRVRRDPVALLSSDAPPPVPWWRRSAGRCRTGRTRWSQSWAKSWRRRW